MVKPACWIPEMDPRRRVGCAGRLQRAHLVPKRLMRREIGVLGIPCPRCAALPGERCANVMVETGRVLQIKEGSHLARKKEFELVIWDSRCWRWMCETHHRALDDARTLRVPRLWVPEETEQFAGELGLDWWLDREYGPREMAA